VTNLNSRNVTVTFYVDISANGVDLKTEPSRAQITSRQYTSNTEYTFEIKGDYTGDGDYYPIQITQGAGLINKNVRDTEIRGIVHHDMFIARMVSHNDIEIEDYERRKTFKYSVTR
jgi:hypothetical protein